MDSGPSGATGDPVGRTAPARWSCPPAAEPPGRLRPESAGQPSPVSADRRGAAPTGVCPRWHARCWAALRVIGAATAARVAALDAFDPDRDRTSILALPGICSVDPDTQVVGGWIVVVADGRRASLRPALFDPRRADLWLPPDRPGVASVVVCNLGLRGVLSALSVLAGARP